MRCRLSLPVTFSFTDFRVFFRIFFREFFREFFRVFFRIFFHELFRGLRFQIDNSFKGALHFIFHISLTLIENISGNRRGKMTRKRRNCEMT